MYLYQKNVYAVHKGSYIQKTGNFYIWNHPSFQNSKGRFYHERAKVNLLYLNLPDEISRKIYNIIYNKYIFGPRANSNIMGILNVLTGRNGSNNDSNN